MICESQHELLKDIFSNTERPDKITICLDAVSRSIAVKYEDLDDEWFKELQALAAGPAQQPEAPQKYVAFVQALRELCKAHGVQIAPHSYDLIAVWDLKEGENPIYLDATIDCTKAKK